MVEEIPHWVCAHAEWAPFTLFGLLLLGGLLLPISEDLILLSSGAIVATCLPNHYLTLYLWVYAGCVVAAWEVYWIGRLFGPRIYEIKMFHPFINPHRLTKLQIFYESWGFLTFFLGRFVPGGFRNALFLSCGLGKMPFHYFILRDGLALLISSSLLFYIGWSLGKNYELWIATFNHYSHLAWGFLIAGSLLIALWYWVRHRFYTKPRK